MEDQDIVVNKRYFQIIHLAEDRSVATLKDWEGGSLNGETRTIKVRWEEDAEIIRDGLMKEDEDLFCTVFEIMEKEVMVNFQLKLKDPPILKMPDLVMDMIFSSLPLKDLLISRSVCPEWGFANLPIQRVFSCKSLSCYSGPSKEVRYIPHKCYTEPSVSINLNSLPAMIEASLFENLEKLEISFFHDPQLPTLLEKFPKTKKLVYTDEGLEPESWVSVQKFISNNLQYLEEVRIDTEILEDIVKLEIFGNSTSLQSLQLILCRNSSLGNLDSLPCCITHLCLLKLCDPLSSTQVAWIATNLTKLIKLELHVRHTHYENEEEEEDEMKGSVIADILSNHPTLQAMYLGLGSWDGLYDEDEEVCEAVKEMKTSLRKQFKTKGWEVEAEEPYTIVERLTLTKVGYQPVFSFYDDWEF